jgi:CHAT domain
MTSNTPDIETRWIVIVPDSRFLLAAQVASYLSRAGVYVPFLWFPDVDHPHEGASLFGKDGYLARVLGDRSAIGIANALSRMNISKVIFLGLTEMQKGYMYPHFTRKSAIVEVSSFDEVVAVCGLPLRPEKLLCRPSQALQGLFLAMSQNKQLGFQQDAGELPDQFTNRGPELVVIESGDDIDGIASVSFAFSSSRDVVFVPTVEKAQVRSVPRIIEKWSRDRSDHEYAQFRRAMLAPLRSVSWSNYRAVTFFTEGVPYGLLISNHVPCAHVLRNLQGALFVLHRLLDEYVPRYFGSALLFSPQSFNDEEIDSVDRLMCAKNLITKTVLGRDATVKNLDSYGSYYPYDILHICAHGGETNGYFVLQDFIDREGAQHTIEFYEVVGFEPASSQTVVVHRKLIFHKLDGHFWMTPTLKNFERYIFEDLMVALREKDQVTRISYKSPIALSCHVKCSDSIHQGQFSSLAGFGMPLVFNNTCSSSHELAVNFIHAGARCYIGSLWSVGNETATKAAKFFYEELADSGEVLKAFFKMNRSIREGRYSNIYIMWGMSFASFYFPKERSSERLAGAILETFRIWLAKVKGTQDEVVRKNCLRPLQFIAQQTLAVFGDLGISPPPELGVEETASNELPSGERSVLEELSERFG